MLKHPGQEVTTFLAPVSWILVTLYCANSLVVSSSPKKNERLPQHRSSDPSVVKLAFNALIYYISALKQISF